MLQTDGHIKNTNQNSSLESCIAYNLVRIKFWRDGVAVI